MSIALFSDMPQIVAATAYDNGKLYGAATVCVLFAVGAIHCFKIATRATTNAKACRGLGVDLIALFCMKVVQTAQAFIPASVGFILFVAGMGVLLVGLVFAILGLVEIARAPQGRYQQGLRQGVGAVIMSLLLILIVATNLAGDSLRPAQSPNQLPQKNVYTFGELNVQISGLAPSWSQLESKSSNPMVRAEFERRNPTVFMRVMAQKTNGETLDALLGAEIEIMKKRSNTFQVNADKPTNLAGIAGREILFQVQPKNTVIDYLECAVVSDGYLYKFIFWKDHDAEGSLQAESAPFLQCVSFGPGK